MDDPVGPLNVAVADDTMTGVVGEYCRKLNINR